jgi:hypothetical protein
VESDESQEGTRGSPPHRLTVARQRGSHRTLKRDGWANLTFAFHDQEELGPTMLSRIAKLTGLTADDL